MSYGYYPSNPITNFQPNWLYTPSVTVPNSMPVQSSTLNKASFSPIQIIKVHGKEGAQAYVLPPSSSILLLDETDSVIWLKTTDDGGYATLTKFYITPAEEIEQAQKENQFNLLENRISNIENQFNQLQNQYEKIEEKINNVKSYSSSYAAKNTSNSNAKQSNSTSN